MNMNLAKNQSKFLINILDTATFWVMVAWLFLVISLTTLLILSLFSGFSGTIPVEWPVVFSEQLQTSINLGNQTKFARPHGSDFIGFNQLSADLRLIQDRWPYFNFYTFLATIIEYTLLVSVVYLFRKIILSIKQQKPFNEYNIRRLKYMALLLFALFPFDMIDSMINHWYIINYVEMIDVEFISRVFTRTVGAQNGLMDNQVLLLNKHSISLVIYALIVYAIAVIFEEGLKLKEDNESIL